MEELPQKQNPEQLHTDESPVQEPEYTLEEIMREFGGWTKREEEPAPKAPEPVEAAAQEGRPQDAAEPPPEQQAKALKNGIKLYHGFLSPSFSDITQIPMLSSAHKTSETATPIKNANISTEKSTAKMPPLKAPFAEPLKFLNNSKISSSSP